MVAGNLIENGNFLSHSQVSETYGVDCTFLDVLSIRQKPPFLWKETSVLEAPLPPEGETEIYLNMVDNSSLCIEKVKANLMYWNIIDKQDCTLTAVQKLEMEFPSLFTSRRRESGLWKEIFSLPYRTQKEVKLESLQYKILARIIPCNLYLQRIGVKESNLCDHCQVKDDWVPFFSCV